MASATRTFFPLNDLQISPVVNLIESYQFCVDELLAKHFSPVRIDCSFWILLIPDREGLRPQNTRPAIVATVIVCKCQHGDVERMGFM